jgi:hypothetical protein
MEVLLRPLAGLFFLAVDKENGILTVLKDEAQTNDDSADGALVRRGRGYCRLRIHAFRRTTLQLFFE